jgi:hypothetical protein
MRTEHSRKIVLLFNEDCWVLAVLETLLSNFNKLPGVCVCVCVRACTCVRVQERLSLKSMAW